MKKSLLISCMFLHVASFLASETLSTSEPFKLIHHSQEPIDYKNTYIIGGDVATSTVSIGIFQLVDGKPKLVLEFQTPTLEIDDFTKYFTVVMNYFTNNYPGVVIKLACFACPGATNKEKNLLKHAHHAWSVDGQAIEAATGIEKTFVVNDFAVVGFGIQSLDSSKIDTLHAGKLDEHGTQVIVGAGNGLGTGMMIWNDQLASYTPVELQFSFLDFAPHNEQDLKLSEYLQQASGSRSWGKVLGAGGGIERIYDFLHKVKSDLKDEDRPAYKFINPDSKMAPGKRLQFVLTQYQEFFTKRHTDKICAEAVKLFMRYYARLVRSVAYAQASRGGVYITNSIAENNPELITDPEFIKEVFNTENDYLSNYLKDIPFYLVKRSYGLQMFGAAAYALVYAPKDLLNPADEVEAPKEDEQAALVEIMDSLGATDQDSDNLMEPTTETGHDDQEDDVVVSDSSDSSDESEEA